MSQDAIRASRLPDLPNAGYSTKSQRELTDAIMFLIRGLERDRPLLLEVVIHGKLLFRKRFISAFKAIKADEQFADAVYGYLELMAGPNPVAQKAILDGMARQAQRERWDKRLSTAMKGAKDMHGLREDIVRESLKPRRIYSKH